MRLDVFEFDLSVPRDGHEIVVAGTELTVDVCTGEAWVQLDSQELDPIPLHRIGSIRNASFTKLYLSNPAQPGKFLRFYVGYGVQLSRTYLTIQDVLRALEEEKELVDEFTSRDIIKKLVDENIVTSEMIKLRSLLEQHFSDGAVTGRVIADNSIEARHIQANSIESDHIVAGSILGYHIAANSILSEHIVSGAISSDHIQANAIQANHIAAGAILSEHIAVNSIRAEHITSDAIRAEHIAAGAISASHVHANSITVDKLESSLYGDLIQYFSILRTHLSNDEKIIYSLTEGIFNSGTANNCYMVYEAGQYHIYISTSVKWDDEDANWDNSSINWDIPLSSGYWESDVFDIGDVLTGIIAIRYNSDVGSVRIYVSRSIDGSTWTNWEELTPFLYLDSISHQSTITQFRYFKVRIQLIGFTHLFNVQIIATSTTLNATTLDGLPISSFVLKNQPGTITAIHTYNPSTVSAPFILGPNARGQIVAGLNADMLDGHHISDLRSVIAPELIPIDLSSATEDYPLQPNCIAVINFSNTTTVPLHIATTNGSYYELHIIPSNAGGTSGATDSHIFLYPNNTTYTNAFWVAETWRNSSTLSSAYTNTSAFKIGYAFSAVTAWITNRTQYKNVRSIVDIYGTSTGWPTINQMSSDWRDTTTAWTSLGTIVFPQNSSGTIVVFRLR